MERTYTIKTTGTIYDFDLIKFVRNKLNGGDEVVITEQLNGDKSKTVYADKWRLDPISNCCGARAEHEHCVKCKEGCVEIFE